MFVVIWLGVAVTLGVALRKAGPWWRVSLGSAAWPLLPAIAVASKLRHTYKRRKLA